MKLVIEQAALAELQAAAAFYSEKASAELGLALVAEFERGANLLLANPLIGTPFRGTSRRYVLRRFPYSIIYRATANEIQIVAVAHHRRRPGYWTKRK
ncbi:MAG: type II toxin-antitoxin system RelE/ParE family toxin [Rhodocyclales bacterium]|nr:type II toxin-antitoxin system RelE/ParE family toxin [Rhodocyclales bacterium]MBI5786706.1 type II toxin-antitoxin system RelE/ParE family toxin [Rhodocyclales bacterium]